MQERHYDEIFEFGLKDGRVVHVDEVQNGLACGCICPSCEAPLVAYNNPSNKKVNHFHHKGKSACTGSYETALHYLAKEIILQQKSLTVPDVQYNLSGYAESYIPFTEHTPKREIRKSFLKFDKVEIERNSEGIRPDLKCYVGERFLFIEIAVTHFIDHSKSNKINLAGVPVLEIDLSEYDRAIQKDKLKEILSGHLEKMRWVFNPKITERYGIALKKGERVKQFIMDNHRLLKVYGKEKHVYNCPIWRKQYDKIKVKEECSRCRYFVGEWEHYESREVKRKYPDVVEVCCLGHKTKEFDNLLNELGIAYKKVRQ